MSDVDERTTFLGIYLEDHVAGATAGTHRAQRLADAEAEAGSSDAPQLQRFATELSDELKTLLRFMEQVGFAPSRVKSGIASVGEKLGALKPNGRLTDRSPLSTIIELEAMQMAVRAKRSLWESLQATLPESADIDLDRLIVQADEQLALLSGLHAARVPGTFALHADHPG